MIRTQLETARAQATERKQAAGPEAAKPETKDAAKEHATSTKTLRLISSMFDASSNVSSYKSESSSSSYSDDSPSDAANTSRTDRTAARGRKCIISSQSSNEDDDVCLARRRRIQSPPSPYSASTQIPLDSQ